MPQAQTTPTDSIVEITSPTGLGTGVIIGPHTILTASHVVEDSTGQTAQNLSIIVSGIGTIPLNGAPIIDNPLTFSVLDGPPALDQSEVSLDYAVINTNQNYFQSYTPFVISDSFPSSGGQVDLSGFSGFSGDLGLFSRYFLGVPIYESTIVPDAKYGGIRDWSPAIGTEIRGASGGPVYIPGTNELVGIGSTTNYAVRLTPAAGSSDDVRIAQLEDAPVISGTTSGVIAINTQEAGPFSDISIADFNSDTETETATVTFSSMASGSFSDSYHGTSDASSYSVVGSAAQVTSALDSLMFVPTEGQAAGGENITTDFTISVNHLRCAGRPSTSPLLRFACVRLRSPQSLVPANLTNMVLPFRLACIPALMINHISPDLGILKMRKPKGVML